MYAVQVIAYCLLPVTEPNQTKPNQTKPNQTKPKLLWQLGVVREKEEGVKSCARHLVAAGGGGVKGR